MEDVSELDEKNDISVVLRGEKTIAVINNVKKKDQKNKGRKIHQNKQDYVKPGIVEEK